MSDPYRVYPPPTDKQRDEIRESIAAVGLKSRVVVDEHGNVIDGHLRRDICEELGIDWMVGADVRAGLNDLQKKSLAIELNEWRRKNLTQKQRQEIRDIYIMANPTLSGPIVGRLFAVSPSTVNRRKQELVQSRKLPAVTATVGKDGVVRRICESKKKSATLIVKNRAEFEAVKSDLEELAGDIQGLIRRPKRLKAKAARKRAEREVANAPQVTLPDHISIRCCDFRHLALAPKSVDVVLTDVVWSRSAESDWIELARLARCWLRDDGILASVIGTQGLPWFFRATLTHLEYGCTMSVVFDKGYRSWSSDVVEGWRAIVVVSKSARPERLKGLEDTIKVSRQSGGRSSKEYHDWQQCLDTSIEAMRRLTRPGDMICDPFVGTGTNAVACALLGEGRRFMGCDIHNQQVRKAHYRVAREGFPGMKSDQHEKLVLRRASGKQCRSSA